MTVYRWLGVQEKLFLYLFHVAIYKSAVDFILIFFKSLPHSKTLKYRVTMFFTVD